MIEHRIVSLLPSATEIVAALDCLEQLVGRSHECDWPSSVETLPVCCHPRIDPRAPGDQVHRQVLESLASAGSVFEIDIDCLSELQPTIILTQDQCDVCAVSLLEVQSALATLTGTSVEVVSLAPSTLEEVWQSILDVGTALAMTGTATRVVQELREQLTALTGSLAEIGQSDRPRVACIEWIDPLMVAGNWVPELVESAGGQDVLGVTGEHSPWISWETLQAADPDRIVVMPCGFDIKRTREELASVVDQSDWKSLRAVSEDRVTLVDGHAFFNRPGPRLVDSATILAEIFHPGVRAGRHAGHGWQPL